LVRTGLLPKKKPFWPFWLFHVSENTEAGKDGIRREGTEG